MQGKYLTYDVPESSQKRYKLDKVQDYVLKEY